MLGTSYLKNSKTHSVALRKHYCIQLKCLKTANCSQCQSSLICVSYAVDVGTRNHRRLCAVYYSRTPGFEVSMDYWTVSCSCWRCPSPKMAVDTSSRQLKVRIA